MKVFTKSSENSSATKCEKFHFNLILVRKISVSSSFCIVHSYELLAIHFLRSETFRFPYYWFHYTIFARIQFYFAWDISEDISRQFLKKFQLYERHFR